MSTVVGEAARVLAPGGRFVMWSAHPCFNGPAVERRTSDGAQIVHPIYRQARRHTSQPWWAPGGIRQRVGGVRHVPLSDLLNAVVRAGLVIDEVQEPGDDPFPTALVIAADRR